MVRVLLAPAKDPGRRVQLAGIARSFNRSQASDQLLVKISAFGQGPPADAIEGFAAKREAGVESASGVFQTTGMYPCARSAGVLNFFGNERERCGMLMICRASPVSLFSLPVSSQFERPVREPSGDASRVSLPDGLRRTATICAASFRSLSRCSFLNAKMIGAVAWVGASERGKERGDRSRCQKVESLLLSTFWHLLL